MDKKSLILASGSLSRKELMTDVGYDFSVEVSDIPEQIGLGESFQSYVLRLASTKAAAVAAKNPCSVVLAADTIVISPTGSLLEKPFSIDDSIQMLMGLSGKEHYVMTGVAIFDQGQKTFVFHDTAKVSMRDYDLDDVRIYVKSSLTLRYSGGYSLAKRGAFLVSKVDGDYTTVIGLPMHLVVPELKKIGIVPTK